MYVNIVQRILCRVQLNFLDQTFVLFETVPVNLPHFSDILDIFDLYRKVWHTVVSYLCCSFVPCKCTIEPTSFAYVWSSEIHLWWLYEKLQDKTWKRGLNFFWKIHYFRCVCCLSFELSSFRPSLWSILVSFLASLLCRLAAEMLDPRSCGAWICHEGEWGLNRQ